ncbi:GufA family transport protein (probable substrate zinc) [Natrialba magadii ATCC 43099]|uniref:GufA family transport protein (Probable substrate zinc) n=1 Tax=Natrialba magadii (strain ATCC 43099 / DSM 3394 / CCM 3739 / CIP 104546 / IAM 13178 / JCM 8861 / NBRC 102185 / NCIMB 2190 / MS3) TaxID=547559 RepID=D3T096_NATMM|nr:ZIP family metal transporter [Natrialba magadii]ADD04454.1 GufA family transport protein (probable substrate zinc) [Natrialba magadii ATCC 43099]ELY25849.1 zinc/iron permease [Natrialba magadii ATCC 43099]
MVSLAEVVLVAAVAGGVTGLGALPLFLTDRISHRVYDGALGLAAGIMVVAVVFALIVPGLELGSPLEVVAGVLAGGAVLLIGNAVLPHLHLRFRADRVEGTAIVEPSVDPVGEAGANGIHGIEADSDDNSDRTGDDDTVGDDLRRATLVGSAVTIHNVPERFAVGIAFASGESAVGFAIATAIAVQNVPDGFAMAVPAVRAGVSRQKTLVYTTLSGGVPEPLAAAAGFALVTVVTGLLPVAAGFAAGAMIAVVFRELVPSSHGHGYADTATAAFILGFALMLVVDTVLAV